MRWMAFLLVFANVAYFAWGSYHESRMGYVTSRESTVYESATYQNTAYKNNASQRLVLLSEVSAVAVAEASDAPEPSSATLTTDVGCLFLGPFDGPAEVDALQQQLRAIGINSQQQGDGESTALDYWVHIPPLPSRVAAVRLLRELQAQKVDSFVITYGELANGISLGLFVKEASAKSVQRRLSNAGYQVNIKTLSHSPEKWWLEMPAQVESKVSSKFWAQLSNRHPEVKKLKKRCESIATDAEFQ